MHRRDMEIWVWSFLQSFFFHYGRPKRNQKMVLTEAYAGKAATDKAGFTATIVNLFTTRRFYCLVSAGVASSALNNASTL